MRKYLVIILLATAFFGCNHTDANQPTCVQITGDTTFVLKSMNWSGAVFNVSFIMNEHINSDLKVSLDYPPDLQPSTKYALNYTNGYVKVDSCFEYYATSVVGVRVKNKFANPVGMCFKFNDFRFNK